MIQVKVCGITTLEEAVFVNRLQPDYVGFVFAPSKRRVDIAGAAALAGVLSKGIQRVGVFVNQESAYIMEAAAVCQLDIIQLHGQESPEDCAVLPYKVWKAVRVKDKDSLQILKDYPVDGILLDTYMEGVYGGMGKSFPWDYCKGAGRERTIILAGGLQAANVIEGIEMIRPRVVDVSSGVETNGKKDFDKVQTFIKTVRGWRDV